MDSAYALTNGKAVIEKSSTSNQQHKETDPCSPFCTCNCCAGFTFLLTLLKLQPVIHVIKKQYCFYLSCPATEISFPVWQPPHIS